MRLRSVHGGRKKGRRLGRQLDGPFGFGALMVTVGFVRIGVEPAQVTKLAVAIFLDQFGEMLTNVLAWYRWLLEPLR
jgi:hypothetical protein